MDIDDDSPPPSDATARASRAKTDLDDEDDPIVASYNIYSNPALPSNRQILILQHPNRQGQIRETYQQINEVRMKPSTGMVEVDVPLGHANSGYDRDKGVKWGAALSKSVAAKGGGSHGLAGGFGLGLPAMRGGKRKDEERELDAGDWTEALRQDKVLRTQTLGGQFPAASEAHCQWMVGVFKGEQLHLTPANAVIQLRPQLHHLDAATEQDRLTRSREGGPGGGKEGGGAGGGPSSGPQAARAITMSIKGAGPAGSGEPTTDTMADRLRLVQQEPWRKLRYANEESSEAWDMFGQNLVYRPRNSKDQARDEGGEARDKGKGEGKEEKEEKKDGRDAAPDDHLEDEEQLQVRWGDEEYLRAVSGFVDGREGSGNGNDVKDEKNHDDNYGEDAVQVVKKEDSVEQQQQQQQSTQGTRKGSAAASAAATTGKGKPKAAAGTGAAAAAGGSNTTTKRAGPAGKGKSVAFKGTGMDVD
ncbi:hypothetical protein F4778DRAFT_245657 [Xylariomycetidae sp. FL2044]|nr:hypothetical protein F4778DRAFT_245657 [Xylariomycetidae sp. FL2044]